MENRNSSPVRIRSVDADLDALLHPSHAFAHPRAVVEDGSLSRDEKRAILASWASDACAVEATPALRQVPGSANVVTIDEILEALRDLDFCSRGGEQDPARPRTSMPPKRRPAIGQAAWAGGVAT
jgi:hypothetical protein